MNVDTPDAAKDQSIKEGIRLEVIYNNEKRLLASIINKGILHKDVQELFHKVRGGYQNAILHNLDLMEHQEVEYFLWKLHYKHIDEFRKKIKQCSIDKVRRKGGSIKDDADAHCSINEHMEGFKTFLSEANEFYKNLLEVFTKQYCHPKELVTGRNSEYSSDSVKSANSNAFQYICHRFLICLGDLARYNELCKKQDAQNWSVAFSFYLEATVICPESGNPHNQLALLATYVGDAFLALYHCIRSLAVKEPFPDAWNNLMLLFDENRTRHLHSFSSETSVDISKSSELKLLWPTLNAGSRSSSTNNSEANICSGTSELWLLFVRLASFFLVKCSLEDFASTLSSTIKCLEVLLQLDDPQLSASLESYELMGSPRKGPYRVLHLVSILIFIVDGLTIDILRENMNREISQSQLYELTRAALVVAFSCISPLLERCLKCKIEANFALVPAVLVFLEWLAGAFQRIQQYTVDEEVTEAMSYFFYVLADFLNKVDHNESETASDSIALWEDYELRGFEPTAKAQDFLDFAAPREWNDSDDSKSTSRLHRIFLAGLKLADRSNGNKLWLLHDNNLKKFYTADSKEVLEPREVEVCNTCQEDSFGVSLLKGSEKFVNISTEEEEIIVFNPLTRHSSAPLHKYVVSNEQISGNGTEEENALGNERLRRATSMFTGPKQPQLDGPPNFFLETMNSKHYKSSNQSELPLKDMETFPAGPPSLSAWVFDTESSRIEQDQGIRDFNQRSLSPIAELDSESFTDLSINESKKSVVDSAHISSTAINFPSGYVPPVPSAPVLPDNAFWFGQSSSGFSEGNHATVLTRETDGILGAAPINEYSNVSSMHGQTGLVHGYPPLVGMSSSEWLYHYRNYHKLEQASSPILPLPLNGPEPISTSHPNYVSRFDSHNPWGNHLVSSTAPALYMETPQLVPASSYLGYMANAQRGHNLQLGYQIQSQYPYIYGDAATGTRPEQPPLFYYLKEWQLQKEPQLRGDSFIRN